MPLDAGQNFAPVKPLQDLKKTSRRPDRNSSNLSAFFRDKYQEVISRSPEARREQIEMGRNIAMLRAGKLVMKRDTLGGGGIVWFKPTANAQNAAANRSNFPLFPQNSETLKAKWAKARPQVQVRVFGDGYRAEIQANAINTIMRSYFKDIFTPEYELNEALSAQDYGTYITRFFIDDQLNPLRQLAPIIKDEPSVLMEGYGACKECGHETTDPNTFKRPGSPYPQCPECDSFKTTKMVNPVVATQSKVVDVEEIVQGDISGGLVPFPATVYDPGYLPQQSPYLIISQYVPLRLAKSILGEIDIQADDNDEGLELLLALANRGGNASGLGENNFYTSAGWMDDRAIVREMWLKPEEYAGHRLEKPEETLAGTIPADVPLEEIWPDGIMVEGWNDFTIQTKVIPERPAVVGCPYYIQSFSGYGKGLSDGIDIAKDLNELHSMAMASIKRFGAGGIYYDSNAATPEEVRNLFKPGKAVPIDLSKNGLKDVRSAIGQLQTTPVNPVIPQYAIQLSNLLNMTLLTGDFTQGMVQDVDINTFGGQQLAHAKSEEQKGAVLTMKVQHREWSATEIFKLFREHIKIPKFFSAMSDKQGPSKGKYISGADMPEQVKFDAVPDSEISVNTFEKRMAAQEMMEKSGGIGAIVEAAMAAPKMVNWAAKKFGVTDLPIPDEEELRIVCLARVDEIKKMSALIPDPEQILMRLTKPLWVRETDHIGKSEFLCTLLDDDEVATWNPVAKSTLSLLIERHRELQVQSQLKDQIAQQNAMGQAQANAVQNQMAANAPMVAQQQAMQQQAADQQTQDQIGNEILTRAADEETKDGDHARSEEAADNAHQRALELEKAKAQNKPPQS